MLAKRHASAQDPDGVIDLERLRRADRIDRTCRNTLGFPVPLPQPAAGALGVRSVYRHGGLTLMEMPTPWLVPEPATRTAGDRARGAKSKTLPGGGAELRC